jgi:hypothetical protein
MNTFNRVVVILILLAIIIVMTVVLVVPRPMIEVVQRWLSNLDANLAPVPQPLLMIVGVALALLVDVICAVLIWLEIRRRRPGAIRVQRISGGVAELTVDSVARRVEHKVSRLDGVISVKPDVIGRRGGVEVELDLEMSSEIDVPSKTEEICQVVKEAVEDKMGLKLRKVRANIKHAPYAVGRPITPQPAPRAPQELIVPEIAPDVTEQQVVSEDA